MEKEALEPSSLRNEPINGSLKRKLELDDIDNGNHDPPPKKTVKLDGSGARSVCESSNSTVEFLDNKFVLSKTNGVYKCVSAKFTPPNNVHGTPGEVGIWIGYFRIDHSGCLTPARSDPLTSDFRSSGSEMHLTWQEYELLCQIMPKLCEQHAAVESEIANRNRINLDGSLFACKNELGSGAFGKVVLAFDIDKLRQVALKFQKPGSAAKKELQVLQEFQWSKHCPKFFKNCIYAYKGTRWDVSCLELLDKDLHDYRREQMEKNSFMKSEMYCLWLQSIQALQDLHSIGFIHCDIKPGNFMIGKNGGTDQILKLIDFNLARKYRDDKGISMGQHGFSGLDWLEKYQNVDGEGNCVGNANYHRSIGTIRYSSINAHDGKKCLSQRDDMESLFYTFVELIHGKLPWANYDNDADRALIAKRDQSMADLVSDMPGSAIDYYYHVRNLGFTEKPDYKRLSRFITDALKESLRSEIGPTFDWSEWCKSSGMLF